MISVLFYTKRSLFHNFIFFTSYVTQKFKYPLRQAKRECESFYLYVRRNESQAIKIFPEKEHDVSVRLTS